MLMSVVQIHLSPPDLKIEPVQSPMRLCTGLFCWRAFSVFLGQRAYIQSASAIERGAIQAGRSFSQLRFVP